MPLGLLEVSGLLFLQGEFAALPRESELENRELQSIESIDSPIR